MAPQISEVFHAIDREVVWMHARWLVFCQLFAEKKEHVEILNRCASLCFRFIEDVLYDDVHLALRKLIDRGSRRLSLFELQRRIKAYGDHVLVPPLESILGRLSAKCKPSSNIATR